MNSPPPLLQTPPPAPGAGHSLLYGVINVATPAPGPGPVAKETQATTVSPGASQAAITGGSSLGNMTQDVVKVAAEEYYWIIITAVVVAVLILVILLVVVLRHQARIKGSYRTNESLGEEEEEEEDEASGSDTLLHSNEELEITEDEEKIGRRA